MSSRQAAIYALVDPRDGKVRYVGKTICPETRMKGHCNDRGKTRKARWIQALAKLGMKPEMRILETVENGAWQAAERRWIGEMKRQGGALANHTIGGEGLSGADAVTRARVSAAARARWGDPVKRQEMLVVLRSESRRKAISDANKGRPKSPEHVSKLPQNRPGRKLSPEHRAKVLSGLAKAVIVAARNKKGKPPPPQAVAAAKIALKGNKHTLGRVVPQHERDRRSEALRGRRKTEAHREKIRAAAFRRWARQARPNRELTYQGETMLLRDWACRIGLSPRSLSQRMRIGWSVERALTAPKGRSPKGE